MKAGCKWIRRKTLYVVRPLNALRFVHIANSLLILSTLNISDPGSYFVAKKKRSET